jgi:hypothetical protein
MRLIDSITVQYQSNERSVMLFTGDLALLPQHEAVDVLIVSAFPDDYTPTASSLIGALAGVGVSVADLADDKEIDLRRFSGCWLSREIDRPNVHFRRILCFEPRQRGCIHEVVGDIFRSIVPLTAGKDAISQIAMPVVASGDRGEPAEAMLEALTNAAVHWLSVGLPLDRIKLVLRESADLQSLTAAFGRVKQHYSQTPPAAGQHSFRFDVFVSYSQKDKDAVDDLVSALRAVRPSLRVFLDRLELRPGSAWQQHLFDAIDESRKVICAFSPNYLSSKVCKEEFNIALFRHRESTEGVLLPVYLFTAELPTYMKLIHYEDVREGDRLKFATSAETLALQL